jgi:hypothetical protein
MKEMMKVFNLLLVLIPVLLLGIDQAASDSPFGTCIPGSENVFLSSTILAEPSSEVWVMVTLDSVACPGGATVFLALDPGVYALVPSEVIVPEGQDSA